MNCRSRKKCYRLTEGANKVINGENAEVVTEELTDGFRPFAMLNSTI